MKKPHNQAKRLNFILLCIVIALSAIMILMNYYTIKILSASRAYINGESQYSKGQKEASASLIAYIYNKDTTEYTTFKKQINIPTGDRLAREALLAGNKHEIAYRGFLQAKNDVNDIDDMVWLFDTFKHIGLFAKAINLWSEGDVLIAKLKVIGTAAHAKIANKSLQLVERDNMIKEVKTITTLLTIKEAGFSDTLGIVCRKVNLYLFVTNIVIVFILVLSSVIYTSRLINNIEFSRKRISAQNDHLKIVNKELDQLIYSVTHDLRSPLVSLSGLIELIDEQTDITTVKEFTAMMKMSISKQNAFIKSILRSVEHQNAVHAEYCNLSYVVDDIIAQNHTILNGKQIQFIKELNAIDVYCDETKLQAVLNNLISNAVKYADINKTLSFVKIKSLTTDSELVIEVEDNGIGISAQNKKRIFDKYFTAAKGENNIGLGLYLVKSMVMQMKGKIEVVSKQGEGSTFILKLPATA